MPTDTFLHLKPEKQQLIIQESLAEFAFQDYAQASLNAIVRRVGMAKGSVYQYFGDKKGLYLYLIEYGSQAKMKALAPLLFEQMTKPDLAFTAWLEAMYEAGIDFLMEQPLLGLFLQRLAQDRSTPELQTMMHSRREQALALFTARIRFDQERGLLRSDLSAELMAWQVFTLGNNITDLAQLEQSPDQLLQRSEAQAEFVDKLRVLKTQVRDLIRLLAQGMQAHPQP